MDDCLVRSLKTRSQVRCAVYTATEQWPLMTYCTKTELILVSMAVVAEPAAIDDDTERIRLLSVASLVAQRTSRVVLNTQ